MKQKLANLFLFLGVFGLLAVPSVAAEMAGCAPDFSSCSIPENVLLQLPFLGISGDVIVLESDLTTVSDVFRIFNDVVDTGGGTGLGTLAFLFSSDDSTPLPDPSTYSANAVAIVEDPSGVTQFIGNGTDYVLNAPEPATLGFMGIGLLALGAFARKRVSPESK